MKHFRIEETDSGFSKKITTGVPLNRGGRFEAPVSYGKYFYLREYPYLRSKLYFVVITVVMKNLGQVLCGRHTQILEEIYAEGGKYIFSIIAYIGDSEKPFFLVRSDDNETIFKYSTCEDTFTIERIDDGREEIYLFKRTFYPESILEEEEIDEYETEDYRGLTIDLSSAKK